ncbi:MAG TPA: DUF4386 domain-containing protein [Candidatus Limnocylindrales bacterium]|nr:DUF4386 domain-containing protein [Candidatus Limnocylindrales bacterium]
MTGGLYLVYIVTTVLATVFGQIGLGTSDQVYQQLITNETSYRVGLVFVLLSGLLFLLTAWGLYVLLRPVHPDLALLFLLVNAVGVAIQGASMLGLIGALIAPQAQEQAIQSIETYKLGFVTAQLFFGAWLFPLGYLVYTSTFMPRILGALLLLDGIAVFIWFLQALLLPDYPQIRYPGLAVSFIAEVGLALWLLLKGIASVGHSTETELRALRH